MVSGSKGMHFPGVTREVFQVQPGSAHLYHPRVRSPANWRQTSPPQTPAEHLRGHSLRDALLGLLSEEMILIAQTSRQKSLLLLKFHHDLPK